MRRSRVRAGLLAVVAVALIGVGWKVWLSVAEAPERALEALGTELLPHVAQHIRNFRRVKVKDGRTVWEITAADAQYSEEEHQIVVQQPVLTLYLDGGQRKARLTSRQGTLLLTERELSGATLEGDVVLFIDDLELRTSRAVYDRAADRITAPEDVSIVGRSLDVRARGLEVEVTPQLMHLRGDVRTVLKRDGSSSS